MSAVEYLQSYNAYAIIYNDSSPIGLIELNCQDLCDMSDRKFIFLSGVCFTDIRKLNICKLNVWNIRKVVFRMRGNYVK